MLGTKKTTQKSALYGIGIAVLLCALMALMPMSNFVTNSVDNTEFVEVNDASDDDIFSLPDTVKAVEYEYDPSLELQGMRDQTTKAYLLDDGNIAQLTSNEPIHYQDNGVWENIDLNIVANANGWEVTKNTFVTQFAAEMAGGVLVQPNEFVDPIFTGINPTIVTIDESGTAPTPYMVDTSFDAPTVGGNVIRYPLAEGFDLDYSVESTQVKQNLVIRERPVLEPNAAWFGLTETLRLPSGYGLFMGDTLLGEEITQTQSMLTIRHLETGEVLAEIPEPVVIEEGAQEPYHGTFFIQVSGPTVVLTTAVSADWILDEDRVFPLAIDPTIKVTSGAGGYCYVYYAYCYSSSYSYLYRYYSQIRYLPWAKYTFGSNSALPSGATVDSIKWKQYVSYGSGWSSTNTITSTVLEACGSSGRWSHSVPSATCSGAASSTIMKSGYNTADAKKLISSIWNSASVGSYSIGTGWKTSDICTTASACNSSSGASYITNAQNNSGTVGMGARMGSSMYLYTYVYRSGSSNSYLEVVYSGGTDADAPTADFVPYTGISSYAEGARTFFITLTDLSGIDTTSGNGPTLHYAVNNGTWASTAASAIGTCASTATDCKFKATTPDISAGDYVEYYWKFQDLNQGSGGANVGYEPALTSGQTTPTPYYFAVEDVANAGTAKKMTVLTTDVYAGNSYNPQSYFDRQMTYYDDNDEFVFEFDTSDCGTGSYACWYTSSSTFYNNWVLRWANTPGSGYNGMGGTQSGKDMLFSGDGGYITLSADDGPGMNLIFVYDSTANEWATVGLGTAPSIAEPLAGGTSAASSRGYGYADSYKIEVPGDFTGTFGKFDFNATSSSSIANRLCVGTNGWTYFWRSPSASYNDCTSAYYMIYSTYYTWSGFALGSGYYGAQDSTGDVTYKVGNVAPTPDTFAPDVDHSALADSHSKDRTLSFTITDAGDPPAGLNVSTSVGVGPTVYYRVTPAGGTAGSWTSALLTQESGKTRDQCSSAGCTWSYDITSLERGDTVEYYMTARDLSTVPTGVNVVTTSTESFEVGDPNKMFIVEWRDMGYSTWDLCTYQLIMYDVTNEVEFKYDSSCTFYYDRMMTGYQDHSRTLGETLRMGSGNWVSGNNVFSNNYRISTTSTGSGHETFDLGIKDLVNANTAIAGSSGGSPTAYYCTYYFSSYASSCSANIDIPDDFAFEYFGVEYNGSDSNDRMHLSRFGVMQLISDGSTSTYRTLASYYSTPGALPATTSYAKTAILAPNWGGYGSYRCYDNSNYDCGVYYRTMPFEGKGTDISADITTDTIWDLSDSPIRIDPSNSYLSVTADLTIQPGVVVQVANGKGISFDGACDSVTVNGNSTDHVRFEGQDGLDWLGLAFTNSCSTGTDDRHQFSYVDFANTSDAAIAAGSRPSDSTGPSSSSNVGNFTMSEVTFSNVGSAFSHGSGQGTVVTMDSFSVDGASASCFNFAEDTIATLTEGTIKDCNTDGGANDGAITNVAGSTGGSLFLENTTITNAYVNLIDVDLVDVTVTNVTATVASAQTGTAFGSAAGASSNVVLYNFDADDYATASIEALSSISIDTVDFGTATTAITPGGSSSTANGPSGDNMVIDGLTSGDLSLTRVHPSSFTSVAAGDLVVTGNAITSDVLEMDGFSVDDLSVSGCGWVMIMSSLTADRVSSSCSSSAAPNTLSISGATITHASTTDHAIYARHSTVTVGETAVTSSDIGTNGIELAKGSTNAKIVLIDVTQNNNACADNTGDTGNCNWDAATSATIWFGGLATVSTYRMALIGGTQTQVFKSGHTVTATVVDSNGNELFEVGSSITDATGTADTWVVTGDSNGNTYNDHNLRAFGPAGQNETMHTDTWYPSSGVFNIGSSIDLLLEPAPIDFDQPNMDCAWMNQNATIAAYKNVTTGVYEFDSTPMTVSADLTLDGCKITLLGSALKVKSTATSSPIVTLSNGGAITVTTSPDTGAVGSIKAVSATYGLTLNIESGGELIVDGGTVRDLAQDATTKSALLIGDGATLTMMNSGIIYGASASSDDMATVKIDGGSASIDDSSIINSGQTGTALWVEGSAGSYSNLIVKNAAVGIQSYNAAPQVDGFTSTDNTVGVNAYGGMSLPTIYRSTLLSGKATGWSTYQIDLSTYLGTGNYLQVGANSIYGGGNAHPRYNWASSKYYMITDRYNIEIEDDNGNSWNVTQGGDLGYYPYAADDPASGVGNTATYNGGNGGIPSWHCNYYGYSYGPNSPSAFDGYMYYIHRYWPGGPGSASYPGYYYYPDEFGHRWENIDGVTPTGSAAYYPYHYWGYYYNSYHGGPAGSTFAPPEGYVGYGGYYNVCLDYAYSYYMSSGQGARLTMPIVDISAANISKVTLWIDVLHNRADNYQDRLDFVARSGNTPSDLGNYLRESGTPLFKNGAITGADTGIEVGGAFAAGHFESITVTNPIDSGLEVVGQAAASVDTLTVNGGDYGVLFGTSASGSLDIANADFDNQLSAGVYYVKDMSGDFDGSIENSAGAAFKYGQNTKNDQTFSGQNIANNAIGIEAAGTGDFTLTDVTMANTKDVVISGSSSVDFIEGTVNTSSVEVTGSGLFTRMRTLAVTLTADGSAVEGATVNLLDANGAAAGSGVTDVNGSAEGLTFTTQTVDSSGLTVANLNGYEVSTIAEVDYYYTSSTSNMADFRYAFDAVALTDASGNSASVALTDQITDRICYGWASSAYVMVSACDGYLSSRGSRTLSNGNGGTVTEYGYYGGLATDMSNSVLMSDSPFVYLSGGKDYTFNGSTIIATAGYDWYDTQRWYTSSPYGSTFTMHDGELFSMIVNNDNGEPMGVELGYYYQAMNFDIDNSTLSGIASIASGNGYKSSWWNYNWEVEDVSITNSEITHYSGYTQLNSAIANNEICIYLAGSDGGDISGNTFNNCGVGIGLFRSAYYYLHNGVEGVDNMTIDGNTFNDGGEVADIWLYTNNRANGVSITNNVINSDAGGTAISVYNGKASDLEISGNTINYASAGIYVNSVENFTVDGNDIFGVGDSQYAGIEIDGGQGDVTNNDLIDADGGIILDSMSQPPAPTSSLCTIRSYEYSRSKTCTFTLDADKTVQINLETDGWGSEIGLEITKPDGTTDTWSAGSFSSRTAYEPLVSYTDAGNYTIKVTDTYGDGGANIYALEASSAGGYTGPSVTGNDISLSAGRSAPNAVGIVAENCDGVTINSGDNMITLSDNAVMIEDCDFDDVNSTFTGDGSASTIGVTGSTASDDLTLDGTTISGYETCVETSSGTLMLAGNADIACSAYGVYADDTAVTAINAAVDGGSTGTGLYVIDSADMWIYPLDASGLVGVHVVNTGFRWDGGVADATTALKVEESVGSVENMTWTLATTQIDAGSNAYITSIGNSLDPAKLTVASSATIDEANLFGMDSTHRGAAPTDVVGLMIKSTDGTRASYVSDAFQPDTMTIDGDDSDWYGGNALNPSDNAMPGVMSGDGTNDLMITYIEGDNLYLGLTGEDFSNGDLAVFLSTDGSGSNTGSAALGGAHTLPFNANYALWADDDSSYGYFGYGFLGWGPSSLSNDQVKVDIDGDFAEVSIPFSRMGGMPDQIDIVVAVLDEGLTDIQTIHPTQTISTGLQTVSDYITIELTHGDLADGSIANEVLVYRSYKGSNTPSAAKDYDVMIKTNSGGCADDWAVSEDIVVSTNVDLDLDMLRACPEITSSMADITVDEDSGAYTFSLTNMADDVQDDEATMTWTAADSNLVAYSSDTLVAWGKNGHQVTITPNADEFGTIDYTFEVTDSNGLTATETITFEVVNVNDAPQICNPDAGNYADLNACEIGFTIDGDLVNMVTEATGDTGAVYAYQLSEYATSPGTLIVDQLNEQEAGDQTYTWGASVPADCDVFSVDINENNVLSITENIENEAGGTCTITMTLSDDGPVNNTANPMYVDFSIAPRNDPAVINDWDAANGTAPVRGDGEVENIEWKITIQEDTTDVDMLTFDFASMKSDNDHVAGDLFWTIEELDDCEYNNYFDITVDGDDLVFDLIPNAATNAKEWEIDFLHDNGIHQIKPHNSGICYVNVVLNQPSTAPSYYPNYNMEAAVYDYLPAATHKLGVVIDNVPELVPDYYFKDTSGFDFNGVSNIMTGTYVPVSVTIGAGGDQGPYNYDHMLAVTFHSNGHTEGEVTKYYTVPAYGDEIVVTHDVYLTDDTSEVSVTMDVLTCLDNPCDTVKVVDQRFMTDSPESHRSAGDGTQGAAWSKPGQFGDNGTAQSQRRPLLEDNNWCNNRMTTAASGSICAHAEAPAGEFLSTGQKLPSVVQTIGASSVPSFAPSIVAVSMAGLFISALALASRRDEEEEEAIVEDESAVSPVIATILMVAITVVLSGVIYVWASSLAETDVKGVPRVTFDIEDINGYSEDDGHWRITVTQSENDLATQAVEVKVFYVDSEGSAQTYTVNLADTNGVYGFSPENSDSFVTFVDQVNKEGDLSVSTFNTGDVIFIRTHAPDGTALEDATITLSYAPAVGQGALLRTWSGLSYDQKA